MRTSDIARIVLLISAAVSLHFPARVSRADEPSSAADEAESIVLERVGEEAFQAIAQLFEYDRSIPLEARTVEKIAKPGEGPREKIVFRGTQGFLVPGYLEFPAEGRPPFRCALLLHGWSGSKASWYADGNYISGGDARKALLKKGFAVLALDALCHGDRIAVNDFAPVNHYVDETAKNPRKGYFTLREIYTQTVVDYRRAIDYLETRSEIDADRIGLLGYSMGGTQTFLLTAAEPRVKVSVACAVPAETSKWSLVAPQNYARGIGSRPFLMVMGENDPMCSVEQARGLYSLIAGENTRLMFFGGHHKLTKDWVPPAVDWLDERL